MLYGALQALFSERWCLAGIFAGNLASLGTAERRRLSGEESCRVDRERPGGGKKTRLAGLLGGGGIGILCAFCSQ